MTKDLQKLVRLTKAVEFFPGEVSYSSVWRWTKAIRGPRLRAVMIGRQLFTSRQYVEEFLADVPRLPSSAVSRAANCSPALPQ